MLGTSALLLAGLLAGGLAGGLAGAPALEGCAAGGSPAAPLQAQVRWLSDLEEAQRLARKEGKHLLLAFTGSQWCSHCQRLEAEVLSKEVFTDGVSDSFVLVRLDFDASLRARRDLPDAAQHDAVRAKLGVEEFPAMVLTTHEGQAYQSVERGEDRVGALVDRLVRAQERAAFLEKAVPEVVASVVRSRSKDEAGTASDDVIALLQGAGEHPLARPLVPLVKATLGSSELPEARERAAVAALSSAAVVDDALVDRAFRLDPGNAEGLPEAALAGAFRALEDTGRVERLVARTEQLLGRAPVVDRARTARLYGDAAYWTSTWLEDPARAGRLARFGLRLEPRDRDLRTMLEALSAR